MKYCKECGSEWHDGAKFCKACGSRADSQSSVQRTAFPEPVKKPLSKKTKWTLIVCGVVLALLFGGYKAEESLTSKERLIQKFESALHEKDAEALSKIITSNDKKLKIDKKSVKSLLAYFEEYPDAANDVISVVKNQSVMMDGKVSSIEAADFSGTNMVNLEKKGKQFFLYDHYQLTIAPIYLMIGTNYKDTILYMDDKKIAKADSAQFEKTVGPFLPGVHTLKAALKTDFIDLETKETALFVAANETEYFGIHLDAEEVTVNLLGFDEQTVPKVKYFISGKEVPIESSRQVTFGPVLTDGSMKLAVEAEVPWGTVKTNEIPIDSAEMGVSLANNAEVQKAMMDTAVLFAKEGLEALTTGDVSKFSTASKDIKDEMQDEITSNKEYGSYYKGSYLGSVFDLDSFRLYQESGTWKAELLVNERYHSAEYSAEEDPELEDYESAMGYYLRWDAKDKKWLVEGYENVWGINTENTKEIIEKNPKVYQTTWVKEPETAPESDEAEETFETEVSSEEGDIPDYISELMDGYLYGLVDAVNARDFSLVEPYLISGSELYQAQEDLVKKAEEDGFTETFIDYKITDLYVEGGTAEIETWEKVEITYEDGTSEVKEFNWIYEADSHETPEMRLSSIKKKE